MNDQGARSADIVLAFTGDRAAARRARAVIGRCFTDDDPIADPVLLATSELVTNVVLHTGGGGVLRCWRRTPDVPLRIEVEDFDPTMPALPAAPVEIGGHGLRLLAHLADCWGVRQLPWGKIVWAEFDSGHPPATEATPNPAGE